jgi:hypothetical protein
MQIIYIEDDLGRQRMAKYAVAKEDTLHVVSDYVAADRKLEEVLNEKGRKETVAVVSDYCDANLSGEGCRNFLRHVSAHTNVPVLIYSASNREHISEDLRIAKIPFADDRIVDKVKVRLSDVVKRLKHETFAQQLSIDAAVAAPLAQLVT